MAQATARTTIQFLIFILISKTLFSAPGNDACSSATAITPVTSCGATTGQDLYLATNAGTPTSSCGTTYDVWYTFTVPAGITSVDITVTPTGGAANMNSGNSYIEAFNANNCGAVTTLNSYGCNNIGSTVTLTGLTSGSLYYFRVFTTTNPNTGSTKWKFSVCVSYTPPPSNDECSTAISLSDGVINSAGSVWLATASSGIPVGCATGNPDDDLWYKYTTPASSVSATIALSAIGSNLSSSGAMIQMFTGSCGSLTSFACGTTTLTTTVAANTTYYIRVYSSGTGPIGGTSSGSAFSIKATAVVATNYTASVMNEVFQSTTLSGAGALSFPWEVTYGPDDYLWVTESHGYKAYRIDPSTGAKTTIVDISNGSSTTELTSAEHTTFNVQFTSSQNPWPQGGFAGLTIHPQFNSGKPYVYISYVRKFDSTSSTTNGGVYFRNSLVRFTYNTSTGKLGNPVALCDTLPGSSDHNSQRIIIAPVGGTYYLFYAQGDMGAGQFGNQFRTNNAQNSNSYEGKILRFNLEADADAGSYDQWIPNDNPYNGAKQSAVWCIGIRNNQGFAYDTSLNILYGAAHGPYSDDEINVIEEARNYGHPLIEGFASDGNCNATTAGTAPNMSGGAGGSSCPIINESTAAAAIGPSYKDPLFSAYPNSTAFPSIYNLWTTTTGANANWPTEAWSGLDLYTNKIIPGWYKSLVAASLKWGRLVRLRLASSGTATAPTNTVSDTVSYFGSTNRFRDLAFAPNGKDIFVIMDNNATTSGPGALNPIVPACAGCVVKYTFLGYNDVGGKSSIPSSIDVTDGTVNTVDSATTVTINNTNNNLWVPITGPDGNIMAEIFANGNNLGTIHSAFYKHSGAIRTKSGIHYLDRNMTITPQTQPGSTVKIRLYLSKAEFDALDADPLSGVSAITDLKILKNQDPCSSSIGSNTTLITPTFAEAHGTNGYMLQGDITSFSSFYFASSNITLPLHLLSFKGSLQNSATLLNWETANEINTTQFIVERSTDRQNFQAIGTVAARGNNSNNKYSYTDNDAMHQSSSVLYYRLKIIDTDGGYTYSDIIMISLPFITGGVTVYPNPASREIKATVTVPADGKIQWNLTDNAGRVVLQHSAQLKKGSNNISINIANLSSGFYYLNVRGAGITQKVKVEKL